MKKLSLVFLAVVLLLSCGSNAKYKGEMIIHFGTINNKEEYKEVIETRLKKMKVKSFIISELSDGFSIKLQTSDTARIISLLKTNDKLGLWETYENSEVYPWLVNLNKSLNAELKPDSTKDPAYYPLFEKLMENIYKDENDQFYLKKGSKIGFSFARDTAEVNTYLNKGIRKAMFPSRMLLMWENSNENQIALHALKRDEFTKGPFLDNKHVKDSEIGKKDGSKILKITLTDEGARIFENYTAKNVDKNIAITFGNTVIISPTVESRIEGGLVEITGAPLATLETINDALQIPSYATNPAKITYRFELNK